ncbi:MAG TPA: pirin family protein [Acidimicrobiales bacterium]|nr:pirin family protein [Acidimicrobiales bacterium]
MSGPVQAEDVAQDSPDQGLGVDVWTGRVTDVGGIPVHRALPRRGRRMVGAWCFLDRFGPVGVLPDRTMTVGPHPHIGLHTVTWLLDGEVEHSDSFGNRQMIRRGELNLMTAGNGIAHAEDARAQRGGSLNGVQLWVAQPEATRHGPSAFAHHAELPDVELGSGRATVLLGQLGGLRSPVSVDSPLVGVDITAAGAVEIPVETTFEHGVAVLSGELTVAGTAVDTNQFVYLGTDRASINIDFGPGARVLLLGGEPFESEVLMWWNFVARDRAELERARDDWTSNSGRFGHVDSTLATIAAPRPYWLA